LISAASTAGFIQLTKQIQPAPRQVYKNSKHEEALGLWHILHLFLLNLSMGGLFLVLSHSLLSDTSSQGFLEGPSLYFMGFWAAMLVLIFYPRKSIETPAKGLLCIVLMGILLIASGHAPGILVLTGFAQGFAINHISAFIQSHLSHQRYAYFESKAQTFGRIAMLISVFCTGYLLDTVITAPTLRANIGVCLVISGLLLGVFGRYFQVFSLSVGSTD